eukprot:1289042-Rhodomonas_salina.1
MLIRPVSLSFRSCLALPTRPWSRPTHRPQDPPRRSQRPCHRARGRGCRRRSCLQTPRPPPPARCALTCAGA